MSLSKKNRLIIVLIAILSIVCVLFASLGTYVYFKNKKRNPKAADLTISNYSGLVSFANRVNSGESFAGQTVVLSNSIDCNLHEIGSLYSKQDVPCIGGGHRQITSGSTSYSFAGVFDGQGHTISNFTLTGGYTYSTNKIVGQKLYDYYHDYYLGLFVNLTGTVKRVQVSSVEYSVTRQSNHKTRPTYHTEHKSAIVCNRSSSGTLTECWSSVSSAYQGVSSVSNIMLSSSIINGSGETISSANNTSGLSWSSTGGSTGTTWYYSSSSNSGWPKLRIFITRAHDWKDVTFSANGGTAPSSIKIPGDAYATFSSNSSSITIYDQTVTATSSSCQHATVSWTANSATSYTVNFTKPSRTVTVKLKDGDSTAVTKTSFNVSCCNTITFQQSQAINSSTNVKEWKCTIGTYNYTAPNTYIISSIDGYTSGAKVSANKTITINIQKKTYNLEFN